jgi:ribosomal protein L35AE/L33A
MGSLKVVRAVKIKIRRSWSNQDSNHVVLKCDQCGVLFSRRQNTQLYTEKRFNSTHHFCGDPCVKKYREIHGFPNRKNPILEEKK